MENELNDAPVSNGSDEPEKKSRKGLIVIIIILLVIAACVVIWMFNIANLRDGVIMPYLRNAPFIGSWFSDPEVEEEGRFAGMTTEQLANMIIALEDNINELETEITGLHNELDERNQVIETLRPFEQMIVDYWTATATWNAMIAQGDPIAYADWFNEIRPEYAAQLYEHAIQMNQFNQQERNILSSLNSMETDNAASVLQSMMATNTPLMIRFLRNMSASRRAEIWDALPSSTVLVMVNMLAGQAPTLEPLTAPEINFPPPISDITFPLDENEEVETTDEEQTEQTEETTDETVAEDITPAEE